MVPVILRRVVYPTTGRPFVVERELDMPQVVVGMLLTAIVGDRDIGGMVHTVAWSAGDAEVITAILDEDDYRNEDSDGAVTRTDLMMGAYLGWEDDDLDEDDPAWMGVDEDQWNDEDWEEADLGDDLIEDDSGA
jgi:hypothetical protein